MMETQRAEDRKSMLQRKQEDEILNSHATRTSAEPRVNAYIPEGDFGLPKA